MASSGSSALLDHGDPGGDGLVHLADDGEHRALLRIADRGPGGGRRVAEGVADQRRADQLAAARRQDLGRPAHDLAEDDARVAARAHQRRVGDGGDDQVAIDGGERAVSSQVLESVEDRLDRAGHVVAGVAVGNREDVGVVDLLP